MSADVRLHRRPRSAQGLEWVARAGADLRHLSFGLLRLGQGQAQEVALAGEEAVLVLVEGSLGVQGRVAGAPEGFAFDPVGPRAGVFRQRASAVYLPPGTEAVIRAHAPLLAAWITSPTGHAGQPGAATPAAGRAPRPVWIRPEEVRVAVRGRPGYQREVHDLVDERVPALRLLVGETFNRPGEWSSYPPHKHDTAIPGVETPLEEVYFFRVDPPQGFGVQMLYSPSREIDQAYRVLDGDVTLLPFGYHPVAAAPGYRIYYLWALAGAERHLSVQDDPDHAWVTARPG